jgi:hypothetical protein
MERRSLTLSDVTDALLGEAGLRRGSAIAPSYRYADAKAVLLPVAQIHADPRMLNEEAVRSLLRGIREGLELPPILVHRAAGVANACLVHGMHRWRVSVALGYRLIPCLLLTDDEAAEYGLTQGRRQIAPVAVS